MTEVDAVHRVKGGLLALAVGVLAWRIIVSGMTAYQAAQPQPPADTEAGSAHPHALLQRAQRLLNSEPAKAERLLRAAAWANPADSEIYTALAQLRENQGERQEAMALFTLADRLAPRRASVQWQTAAFWLRQGQLDEGLKHLSLALQLNPERRAGVYPALLELAEHPATRSALTSLLNAPPPWWEDFFGFVAAEAASLDTISALYDAQRQRGHRPSKVQVYHYLGRLQREGRWTELYFTWLNSLEPESLEGLGYLYNGGFESLITRQGFDWQFPSVDSVRVETEPTYGITGLKALKVSFRGQPVQFSPVQQPLLLSAGRYRLQGRIRLDGLQVERGARWEIACISDSNPVLGYSEAFSGSDQWRPFATEFSVPTSHCQAQILRLALVGRAALDFVARGVLWFDDMAIERLD